MITELTAKLLALNNLFSSPKSEARIVSSEGLAAKPRAARNEGAEGREK